MLKQIISLLKINIFHVDYLFIAISCGSPDNGTNAVQSGSMSYGDVAMYTCLIGYKATKGNTSRTCQPDGNWTGSPLQCAGNL